jgi:hypothetical protein
MKVTQKLKDSIKGDRIKIELALGLGICSWCGVSLGKEKFAETLL